MTNWGWGLPAGVSPLDIGQPSLRCHPEDIEEPRICPSCDEVELENPFDDLCPACEAVEMELADKEHEDWLKTQSKGPPIGA